MGQRAVYVVDAKRTPRIDRRVSSKDFSVSFFIQRLVQYLIERNQIEPDQLNAIIVGNFASLAYYHNFSDRLIQEGMISFQTICYLVNKYFASGYMSLMHGIDLISDGKMDLVVAGGVESYSHVSFSHLADFNAFYLHRSNVQGELVAQMGKISREAQDRYAWKAKQLAVEYQRFEAEIVPLIGDGKIVSKDRLVGIPQTLNDISKGVPFSPYGTATEFNCASLMDSGGFFVLASESMIKRMGREPLARIVDIHFCGGPQRYSSMLPLKVIDSLLKRNDLSLSQVVELEIEEISAGQILAILKGMKDDNFAKDFSIDSKIGEMEEDRINGIGGNVGGGYAPGGSHLVSLLHRGERGHAMATTDDGHGVAGGILWEKL